MEKDAEGFTARSFTVIDAGRIPNGNLPRASASRSGWRW